MVGGPWPMRLLRVPAADLGPRQVREADSPELGNKCLVDKPLEHRRGARPALRLPMLLKCRRKDIFDRRLFVAGGARPRRVFAVRHLSEHLLRSLACLVRRKGAMPADRNPPGGEPPAPP